MVPWGNWEKFGTDEHGSGNWTVHASIDDLSERAHEAKLGCIQVWVNNAVADKSVLTSDYITIRQRPRWS
jgi:hypothetical protein